LHYLDQPKPAMNTVFIALAVFSVLLIALVMIRARFGKRIEITNTDVVLALLPVALWLFLTGKVTKLGFGGLEIASAIKDAVAAPVDKQVSKLLPVEAVRMSPKGGTAEIQAAIDGKSQALSFALGRGNYYSGAAIAQYLDRLTQYPFLRYLVLNNPDGTFFGLADARQLVEMVHRAAPSPPPEPANLTESLQQFEQRSIGGGGGPRLTAQDIADWLNRGDAEAQTKLETLPGFIGKDKALDTKTDRQKALEIMNTLDLQTIPVIDDNRKFVGIVDRSKLTASILTDVAARVNRP
jgi:hypothetical protein